MMRALILLHRWLGVVSCLLFAMWFATGIVMHFVPFPALTEAERFAGLPRVDLASVKHGPAEALRSSGIKDAAVIRLIQRSDGPVYLVPGRTHTTALYASDLSDAAVHTAELALAIATNYPVNRQGDAAAGVAALSFYDQWTVASSFNRYRPLYRVALNDALGTELYVSMTTGEVVLYTARRQRAWNYLGSVAHWIYPTALRIHPAAWAGLLWWLSFLALIGAATGAVVGTLRVAVEGSRLVSPYRGWQALHHWLGLCCMLFILTWIFSGWLSMDNGRLVSSGKPADAEAASITGAAAWSALSPDEIRRLSATAREVEWFTFGGRLYGRERTGFDSQRLFLVDSKGVAADREFLGPDEVDAAVRHLAGACEASFPVQPDDAYAVVATMPGAPVFRVLCGADWFDIDGASGVVLEKLDTSRRVYRWLFAGLHTLDFPILTTRPAMRATLVAALCLCGLAFSLTAVVIAWRRLLSCFRAAEPR
jgi:PepSY-associated TM region